MPETVQVSRDDVAKIYKLLGDLLNGNVPCRLTLFAICEFLVNAADNLRHMDDDDPYKNAAMATAIETAIKEIRSGAIDGVKPVDPDQIRREALEEAVEATQNIQDLWKRNSNLPQYSEDKEELLHKCFAAIDIKQDILALINHPGKQTSVSLSDKAAQTIDEMTTLSQRLEAATEPSRELDAEIGEKIAGLKNICEGYGDDEWFIFDDEYNYPQYELPHYTTSIDAALALSREKLPDCGLELHEAVGRVGRYHASILYSPVSAEGMVESSSTTSLSLALCTAVAKAMEANNG